MPAIDTLHTLLVEELRDIYDAEHQLVKALPKVASHARPSFPTSRTTPVRPQVHTTGSLVASRNHTYCGFVGMLSSRK